MRTPLVIANWKMNGNYTSNAALMSDVIAQWDKVYRAVICTPYVYLPQARSILNAESSIGLGAQDVSEQANGAYTGDISASMLVDVGCQYVLVGHSERREYHQESDQLIAQKCQAAIASQLIPVLCVGESLTERQHGQTLDVIARQLDVVLSAIDADSIKNMVLAYEPIWAIGTGLTATPEQAQDVHAFIRQRLGQAGDNVCILYGGSVKPANASELFAQTDIDGALVGGASLVAKDFLAICAAAFPAAA